MGFLADYLLLKYFLAIFSTVVLKIEILNLYGILNLLSLCLWKFQRIHTILVVCKIIILLKIHRLLVAFYHKGRIIPLHIWSFWKIIIRYASSNSYCIFFVQSCWESVAWFICLPRSIHLLFAWRSEDFGLLWQWKIKLSWLKAFHPLILQNETLFNVFRRLWLH